MHNYLCALKCICPRISITNGMKSLGCGYITSSSFVGICHVCNTDGPINIVTEKPRFNSNQLIGILLPKIWIQFESNSWTAPEDAMINILISKKEINKDNETDYSLDIRPSFPVLYNTFSNCGWVSQNTLKKLIVEYLFTSFHLFLQLSYSNKCKWKMQIFK